MRWHYIIDNDFPEETDTMCLCRYNKTKYNLMSTEYSVAMYTDFEGEKEFINTDGICVNVDRWVKISDIEESIYFDELYAEQNNRLRKGSFLYNGKEVTWDDLPLEIRKEEYPYYFDEDGNDCYPVYQK